MAVIVVSIAAFYKIYEKSNQPGWAIFIPVYNLLVFLKIIKKPWWLILIILAPSIIYLLYSASVMDHQLSNPFDIEQRMKELEEMQKIWYYISIIYLLVHVYINVLLGKVFQKETGFIIGLILLPVIFYPILGFGNSQYIDNSEEYSENTLD